MKKKYTDITEKPDKALQALVDNNANPVSGFAFWSNKWKEWREAYFCGYNPQWDYPFMFTAESSTHNNAYTTSYNIARVEVVPVVRDQLKNLPDGYRQRALAQADPGKLDSECHSFRDALFNFMDWTKTAEDYSFWSRVCRWEQGLSYLPVLPDEHPGKSDGQPIRPDFASTEETVTFWRENISEALRVAADWLEQEKCDNDEDIETVRIAYDHDTDQFGVTMPYRFAIGKRLVSGNTDIF